ncbi:MAG: sigma factor-like helix-turn-helix DNA-binding protein [Eubacteriales bacterium]
MFEKDLRIGYLLDFYGEVLPPRTRAMLKLYYEEDLSLSEMAEREGISRQGIRHLVKRGEQELLMLERGLGLAQQFTALRSAAERLHTLLPQLRAAQDPRMVALAEEVRLCLQVILQKQSASEGGELLVPELNR